jgi:hypothetical protein
MNNEQVNKPVYYDGSGTIKMPVEESGKHWVVKTDSSAVHVKFPVFPYFIGNIN